jgi:acyl-CoA thioesterase FadM
MYPNKTRLGVEYGGGSVMKTVVLTDRRKAPRFGLGPTSQVSLQYTNTDKWKEDQCVLNGFGMDGLGVQSSTAIAAGAQVNVKLSSEMFPRTLLLMGEVIWSKKLAEEAGKARPNSYALGVRFLEVPKEDRDILQEALTSSFVKDTALVDRRLDERRRAPVDFARRKVDRRTREFLHEVTLFLGETNAVGNAYFARHFYWQGAIREAFLCHILNYDVESFLKTGVKMFTVEASCQYKNQAMPFETISLRMGVGEVTGVRIELLFRFLNKTTGILV